MRAGSDSARSVPRGSLGGPAGIEDVARAAGVSTATVSRALRGLPNVSESTKRRVTEIADALGYVASKSASALASGRTGAVGLVAPSVTRWFYAQIIDGAERALRAHGYDLLLFLVDESPQAPRRFTDADALRKRVDSVLVAGLPMERANVEDFAALGVPLAFISNTQPGYATVRIDDALAARLAMEHLLGLGHEEIGYIAGAPNDVTPWTPPVDRRDGWRRALERAGLPVRTELEANGDFTIAGGHRAMLELLDSARSHGIRLTAVFVASDEMAMGAMHALASVGLDVPGDVSVIGIDGHEFGEMFGLTTVTQSALAQGALAAELLLDAMASGRQAAGEYFFPVELLVRGSTASPR